MVMVSKCLLALALVSSVAASLDNARRSHLKRALMEKWIDSSIGTTASGRPAPQDRTFTSSAIEAVIADYQTKLADPDISTLFTNCYPNTLDTTVSFYNLSAPDAFVITGDIDAMWLRDSANQLYPYLSFMAKDSNLQDLACGLVMRHAKNIIFDPYANSFNLVLDPSPKYDENTIRTPPLKNGVCTGNYELDSLAAFMKLSYGVFVNAGTSCFQRGEDAATWINAIQLAHDTIKAQQAGSEEELENPPYKYQSRTFDATGTLMLGGNGVVAKRCGLSKSPFRPSDDANTLPFNIPVNAMTSVELGHAAEIVKALGGHDDLSTQLSSLSQEIRDAIYKYGVVRDAESGKQLFAYEVDGFGASYIMDDANIPSLLSLPYLGFIEKDDPLYLATREVIMSDRNPYYFNGTVGEGIGGPHIGLGYIWPMSIITRAFTSNDDAEITAALDTLKAVSTKVNMPFMHESFWRDDATNYTRSWFAWANSLFGELILTLAKERPHLIFK